MADSDSTRPTRDLDGESRERVLAFHNLRPGSQLAERYRILRPLGHGGSGEVYAVHDEVAGVDVALKVLYPGSGSSSLERLRRELRLLRDVTHPGILRIYDIGMVDGLLYLVTELLEGESLKSLLERSGSLSPEQARGVVEGILDALAAAHGAGILHRDIKPANVFLVRERSASAEGEEGVGRAEDAARVVLLDFGIARRVGEQGLTTRGRFVGTPEYAAPEQILGERELSPAADLYALGVTAWEMLTGRPPFRGDSEFATLEAHVKQPPPLEDLPRDLDSRWREWLGALLEKDPRRRPRSVRDARGWLRGEAGTLRRLRRGLGRMGRGLVRRWVLAAGAVLLLALAAAAWVLTPVALEADTAAGEIVWHTRGGIVLSREVPGEGRLLAALDTEGWGPFRGTWAGRFGGQGNWSGATLFRSRALALPFSLSFRQRGLLEDDEVYAGYTGELYPMRLVALPPSRHSLPSRIAICSMQRPNFPYRVNLFSELGESGGGYSHPGTLTQIKVIRPAGAEGAWLYAAGINNLLGPRLIVVGLPLGESSWESSQAPPYTARHERRPRAGGWYLLLPTARSLRRVTMVARGDGIRVVSPSLGTLLLDPLTGVPDSPRARGGLPAAEWSAQRRVMEGALWRGEELHQRGRPAEGAREIEEACSRPGMLGLYRSTALYRAALLHLRASALDPGELERALKVIRGAVEVDPDPRRYRLLLAELLLRTRHRPELTKMLESWGERLEERMLTYEWMLVDLLAGSPLAPERFLSRGVTEPGGDFWMAAEQSLLLARAGRCGEISTIIDALRSRGVPSFDIHHYWRARCLLEASPPDPAEALEALDRAEGAACSGYAPPLDLARLHARALAAPSSLGAAERARARAALEREEARSHYSLHALFTLPAARADAVALSAATAEVSAE